MKSIKSQNFKVKGKDVELEYFSLKNITSEYIAWLNDTEVLKYSNQRFLCHDYTSSKAYLDSFDNSSNIFLSIKVKKTNIFIGTLTVYFDENHGVADIGIMIGNREEWGKGYGQDAWNTILSWLLNNSGVRKVTAGTLACNIAMINIIKKSGMKLEGTRYSHEIVDDKPQDVILFAIFNK